MNRFDALDEYSFRYLFSHFKEAGLDTELREILLDYAWLYAKLHATDINALLADFEFLEGDETVRLMRDTLQLSAHVLVRDKSQLATQLLGRLQDFKQPEIQGIMEQAKNWKSDRPWLRPLVPSYQASGGSLLYRLAGKGPLALTQDDKRVILVSDDNAIKIWDLEAGKELGSLTGCTSEITALELTPDEKRVIAASKDGSCKVWDTGMGNELFMLQTNKFSSGYVSPAPNFFVMTRDAKRVITLESISLEVWDVEMNKRLCELSFPSRGIVWVKALVLAEDGKQVIVAYEDGSIRVWDVGTGKVIRKLGGPLNGHKKSVRFLALSRDGKRLISASEDKTIKAWEVSTGKLLHTLDKNAGDHVYALEFSGDGKRVIAAFKQISHILKDSESCCVKVWEVDTGRWLNTLNIGLVTAWALSEDGRQALVASVDEKINFHAASYSVGPVNVSEINNGGPLKIWDLDTGAELLTLSDNAGTIYELAITKDEKRVISASTDGTLKFWNTDKSATADSTGHTQEILALALTGDGKQVLSASKDGTLKLWEVETGNLLDTRSVGHPLNGDYFDHWVLLEGGKRLIARYKEEIHIWDEKGHSVGSLSSKKKDFDPTKKRKSTISDIELSVARTINWIHWNSQFERKKTYIMDGLRLLSASLEKFHSVNEIHGELKILTEPDGIQLCTLREWNAGSVTALALTRDGKRVISGSSDKTINVWGLPKGNCLATASLEDYPTSCILSSDEHTVVAGDKGGKMYFLRLEGF